MTGSISLMRYYFAICLLVAVTVSCSRRPDAPPKSTFLINVDVAGQTTTVPVSVLDEFLSERSFSKSGGMYDDHHVLFGMSYNRSKKTLVLVSVANGAKIGFVNVNAYTYEDSPDDFKKLFHELQAELAKRYPGRPMLTQFE